MRGRLPPQPRRRPRSNRLRVRAMRSDRGLDERIELRLDVRHRRCTRLLRPRSLKRIARRSQTFFLFGPSFARMFGEHSRFVELAIPRDDGGEDAQIEIAAMRALFTGSPFVSSARP